ncbi:unnamed protein product [Caenorhabditis sp. 36 PRJEB53466]|nr:unnamed protein product [Caenorhabditis sp. 36 PRJEB53466]
MNGLRMKKSEWACRNNSSRRRKNSEVTPSDSISVVARPIHHVDNVCMCYENREDCSTCSDSSDKSDIFVLDSSEDSEPRLRGGSSPALSSSDDGSSLFEENFAGKFDKSMDFSFSDLNSHSPRGKPICVNPPQNEEIERKATEFQTFVHGGKHTLAQIRTMDEFHRSMIEDDLDALSQRITAEISLEDARIEQMDRAIGAFITRKHLKDLCEKEVAETRKLYMHISLFDEDLMRSNLNRIEELKAGMEWRTSENDDVSTCQSFCEHAFVNREIQQTTGNMLTVTRRTRPGDDKLRFC